MNPKDNGPILGCIFRCNQLIQQRGEQHANTVEEGNVGQSEMRMLTADLLRGFEKA